MSIESATYVNDLQPINPPSSDPRSQGDDHLRLIKQVLQNQFPNATRPRPVERTAAKSANYTILNTDDQTTFYITTTGGSVQLTLPTLLAADAGWEITVMKLTSDANPIFIIPPSGSLFSGPLSLTKARRNIPGIYFRITWAQSVFVVERILRDPIGTLLDFNGSALPAGFEWPNGQTLASASTNYPEYNSLVGSGATPDYRGRVAVTLDNLGGSSAGRLAGGVITGTAIGNTGGTDTVTLDRTMIPTGITSTVSGVVVGGIGSIVSTTATPGQVQVSSGSGQIAPIVTVGQTFSFPTTIAQSGTGTGTSNNTGGLAHSNLQPSIMCSKILVVE